MKKLSREEQIQKIYDELSIITGDYNAVIFKEDGMLDWYPTFLFSNEFPKEKYIYINNSCMSNFLDKGFEYIKDKIKNYDFEEIKSE